MLKWVELSAWELREIFFWIVDLWVGLNSRFSDTRWFKSVHAKGSFWELKAVCSASVLRKIQRWWLDLCCLVSLGICFNNWWMLGVCKLLLSWTSNRVIQGYTLNWCTAGFLLWLNLPPCAALSALLFCSVDSWPALASLNSQFCLPFPVLGLGTH
jgi:hypothetical protein